MTLKLKSVHVLSGDHTDTALVQVCQFRVRALKITQSTLMGTEKRAVQVALAWSNMVVKATSIHEINREPTVHTQS